MYQSVIQWIVFAIGFIHLYHKSGFDYKIYLKTIIIIEISKRVRQYIGLFTAILAYYLIHEGAHLVYALSVGAFKQINFMGLGIQIDIFHTVCRRSNLAFSALSVLTKKENQI